MPWTYIRTHSNDEPRCGETSPLLSAAGRSQCPSDEEIKLIRRPAHATAAVVLSELAGEVQSICKAPVEIVAAGGNHGPSPQERRERKLRRERDSRAAWLRLSRLRLGHSLPRLFIAARRAAIAASRSHPKPRFPEPS